MAEVNVKKLETDQGKGQERKIPRQRKAGAEPKENLPRHPAQETSRRHGLLQHQPHDLETSEAVGGPHEGTRAEEILFPQARRRPACSRSNSYRKEAPGEETRGAAGPTSSVRAVTPALTQGAAKEGTAHQTFPRRVGGKRVSTAGSSPDLAAGRAPLAGWGWSGRSQGPCLSLGPQEAALNTHLCSPRHIGTSGAAPCAPRGAVTEKLRTQLGCRGTNGGTNGGPVAEMENLAPLRPKWGQRGPCIRELHTRPGAARGTAHTWMQPAPRPSGAGRGAHSRPPVSLAARSSPGPS